MKFTQLQQAYIDEVQADIYNPLPSRFYKVLSIFPMLVLFGLVWGHWFGAPKIVGDFAYALMVFAVICNFVFATILLGIISVKHNTDTNKLLLGPYSPLFCSKLQKTQKTFFYLGGFVILVAMGHPFLATATLIVGLFVFLYYTACIKDAKMLLVSIDPENASEISSDPQSF